MFKFKKRSTDGSASKKSFISSRSRKAMDSAEMGIVGENSAESQHNVMSAHADAGAIHEPLVLDFAAMHDGFVTKGQSPPLTPPTSQKATRDNNSWLSDDERDSATSPAPAPPDFTRRLIHVPSRTSSSTPAANKKRLSMQRRLSSDTSSLTMPRTPEPQHSQIWSSSRTPMSQTPTTVTKTLSRDRSREPTIMQSSADSVISYESSAPSIATQALPPLQEKGGIDDTERLSPLLEDDPRSWDLVAPPEQEGRKQFSLERQSEQLLSKEHLKAIFNDTPSLLRFTTFLTAARPKSIPILIYYLDALKALRAISYANAVAEALEPIEGHEFTQNGARPTVNAVLEEKANQAFDVLVRDDLPAFVTHVFTQVVSVSISKRVTGNLPPMLREASEGLAEVFCLTDPSRTDNPIIFASEEFHRTTQYGVSYAIGRNCRFLQGPKTNRNSVARFKEMVVAGKEHSEVFLNYRRDGSPFMNLLMMAPLLDSRGNIRYFIGAQIDVSGLVKDGSDLDAFQHMLDQQNSDEPQAEQKDEFQELSEMFNHSELDIIRKHGGNMHREHVDDHSDAGTISGRGQHRPRVLIRESTFDTEDVETQSIRPEGRLSGPYKHYLLIRPAPSLRILFTSPSLRVPGILQSHFLDRIGGNTRVRESVRSALADGSRGVTAKIRWLSHAVPNLETSNEEGRPRWIHCTPLLGASGAVGVWMVVLVDEDKQSGPVRRFRQAPPVANDVRSKKDGARGTLMDDFDDFSYHSYTPRTSSLVNGHSNSPSAVRHIAVDALRQPSSPRHAPPMYDQRALRSGSSSLRNYDLGREGSVETFNI
ncbi:hypothetical protein FB567DRAFT_611632 [Paraphoma chrysanthemicola]|uniref:PAC domain-containing protein n=1 Tax=Paraphoma chrysanthemicola TaxID=798071 RepID=A0A8K0VSZ0_9PLEO|nr:hypothetical protein FB567DRAFT_611632 [Paraphoma chrysanthemicola]